MRAEKARASIDRKVSGHHRPARPTATASKARRTRVPVPPGGSSIQRQAASTERRGVDPIEKGGRGRGQDHPDSGQGQRTAPQSGQERVPEALHQRPHGGLHAGRHGPAPDRVQQEDHEARDDESGADPATRFAARRGQPERDQQEEEAEGHQRPGHPRQPTARARGRDRDSSGPGLLEGHAELGDALGHLGRQLRVRGGQRALEEDAHVGDREEDVAAALREEALMHRAGGTAGQGLARLGRDDAFAHSDQERSNRDEVGPLPDGGVADLGGHERGDTRIAQARRRAGRKLVGVEQRAGDVVAHASQRHRRHAERAEQAGETSHARDYVPAPERGPSRIVAMGPRSHCLRRRHFLGLRRGES
jgi:hypothetical protein